MNGRLGGSMSIYQGIQASDSWATLEVCGLRMVPCGPRQAHCLLPGVQLFATTSLPKRHPSWALAGYMAGYRAFNTHTLSSGPLAHFQVFRLKFCICSAIQLELAIKTSVAHIATSILHGRESHPSLCKGRYSLISPGLPW